MVKLYMTEFVDDSTQTAEPHSLVESHFPGKVPATAALRVLLSHAGVRAPHTSAPFSEAMLFGIAGGIGIGVFSYSYGKENFASFYLAGRHQWHDDLVYLKDALGAFGLAPELRETTGPKTAAWQLHQAIAQHGPCIAWVDMASLPHRGMPEALRGTTYHVITVYEFDEQKEFAQIGDLARTPIAISQKDLEAARARIRKQRFRLMWIQPDGSPQFDLRVRVEDGLRRCRDGILNPTLRGVKNNAKLEAIETWGERLTNADDPHGWPQTFRPGANLWRALNSVYDFIEDYGTGGGLCRPLFAEFLEEAAAAVPWPALKDLAGQYRELGRGWSELADRALPSAVPAFRKSKELRRQLAELRERAAPAAEVRVVSQKLDDLEREASADFPVAADSCPGLFAGLKARVRSLHAGEAAALVTLTKLLG